MCHACMYRSDALASPTLFNHMHFTACPSPCLGQKTLNFRTPTVLKLFFFQVCPALYSGNQPCPPILESRIWAKLARHYCLRGTMLQPCQPYQPQEMPDQMSGFEVYIRAATMSNKSKPGFSEHHPVALACTCGREMWLACN